VEIVQNWIRFGFGINQEKNGKGFQIPNSFLGLILQRAHFLFSSSLLFFFHVSPFTGPAPAHLGPAVQRHQHPGQSPRRNKQSSCPSQDLIPFQKIFQDLTIWFPLMDKTGRTPLWLLVDLKCPINSTIFPSNFYPQTTNPGPQSNLHVGWIRSVFRGIEGRGSTRSVLGSCTCCSWSQWCTGGAARRCRGSWRRSRCRAPPSPCLGVLGTEAPVSLQWRHRAGSVHRRLSRWRSPRPLDFGWMA
jgi:hypothetical protein